MNVDLSRDELLDLTSAIQDLTRILNTVYYAGGGRDEARAGRLSALNAKLARARNAADPEADARN